jgi:hypothetical protein
VVQLQQRRLGCALPISPASWSMAASRRWVSAPRGRAETPGTLPACWSRGSSASILVSASRRWC